MALRNPRSSLFLFFICFLLFTAYFAIINLPFDTSFLKFKRYCVLKPNDTEIAKTIWASHSHEDNLTCHIPHVDPYHSSILQYNDDPKPIKCEDTYPLLFKSTVDSTIVPLKSLEEYENLGVKDPCCYHDVKRKESKDDPDNAYKLSAACYSISLIAKTKVRKKAEFIAIRCSLNETMLSKLPTNQIDEDNTTIVDMHAFIPVKPDVEKRIMNISTNKSMDKNVDSLNVVILGLDAVSHMNFIRVMPKTYAYLMNNLKAVEMNGFNKIGDYTFPNVAAMLTGLVTSDWTIPCDKDTTFDDCPLIWKTFAQNGYRTSYGEDATTICTFNHHDIGFRQAPTDYYLRPFGVAAEKLIGHHKALSVNQCYGPRLQFNVILNYMKKMAFAMGQNKRYFQFVYSTSLTHDLLNDGKLGDEDLMLTLQWFQNNGYFNSTAFVLMSDHGIRVGKILEYPAGQLELKMPFLFFVFPPWFRLKYKRAFDNLVVNSARLTTPYDLHETLGDLINLNGLTSQTISQRQTELDAAVKNGSVPRDISLFLSVPPTRTCSMAGVEDHFCICRKTTEISVANSTVLAATEFAVEYINSLLSTQTQCAVLELYTIKSAFLGQIDDGTNDVYHVAFVTTPGGGSFDASLVNETEGWTVSGTIGRTNLYGNQSHCVNATQHKLYCYCVDNGI